MENTFRLRDLGEDAEIQILVCGMGTYNTRLILGSPLHELLVKQEIFEEEFDAARAGKGRI